MSLHGYPGERRDWRAFDNQQLGEPDADFYATHCQGCDGPLQSDGMCLSCLTPAELADRNNKLLPVDAVTVGDAPVTHSAGRPEGESLPTKSLVARARNYLTSVNKAAEGVERLRRTYVEAAE